MSNKRLWASLLGFTLAVSILFGLTIALGRTPVLGLDLKGGLSVIYATAEAADEEELVVVRDLMRDQLESFGIAEPDVRVEGENIIVAEIVYQYEPLFGTIVYDEKTLYSNAFTRPRFSNLTATPN